MKNHPIRKSFVALATALSFVLLMAAPASADATITGGTLVIGGVLPFPLGPGANPPCDAQLNKEKPFEFHTDKGGDPDIWWTTGGFAGAFNLNGWHKAEFKFGGLSGTSVPGDDPDEKILSGGGLVGVNIYSLINVPDPPEPKEPCEKDEFICTIWVDMTLTQPSTYTGPNNPPGPPGVLLINASSNPPHIDSTNCPKGSIFLALNGFTADLVNMTIAL